MLEVAYKNINAAPLFQSFYARPALTVARELIGKCLIRAHADGTHTCWPITEVEAYTGAQDLACHGRMGRTQRNAVMFGPAGHWYLYFIYGIHWMLNIVTDQPEIPAAVLIRGAGPADGPGKLTRALGLDRELNGLAATPHAGLWIAECGVRVPRRQVRRTPRIGVDYAGDWAKKPYRWVWDARN
ncbi:MAG: DNA-3-methyladenine glycosylase [Pirellulales bacterium]|nr:DNA-3-methyladenine glycosylase [Pirellulales bacterium]